MQYPKEFYCQLAIVDIHRNFKAKAQIVVAWFFPSHIVLPHKIDFGLVAIMQRLCAP